MAKASRIRRMSAEDFADFCADASAKDVQTAIETGSEWDGRAFISAAASNTDPNVLWVLLRETREKEINLVKPHTTKVECFQPS